jgi:hypothetical protein
MDAEQRPIPPAEEEIPQPRQTACDSMPDFTRNRFFYGQMLAAHDLQTEQDYFREKLKLLNRCLQGYGTVCGLKVVPARVPEDYEQPAGGDPYRDDRLEVLSPPAAEGRVIRPVSAWVEIECGLALDCAGNELIVRHPLRVELWPSLSDEDRREIESKPGVTRLYLSICYCVQAIDPVRPVLPDACNAVSECVYSKLRDSVKVRVTTRRPSRHSCRDNCCDKCQDKCLLLAAIDFQRGRPPVIHNDVRRWVTVYEPVTITGVSWVQAASYTQEEAARIMQEEGQGLVVEFSRAILPETVTKGVFDVIVFEGGKGRHGGMYYLDGEVTVPDNRHVVFRDLSEETLEHDDRVMIVVRTDFILDECCRPVDGNHVGGLVPLLDGFAQNRPQNGAPPRPAACHQPPRRYGAWTSGNGTPGGTFESWFYIRRPHRLPPPRPRQSEEQLAPEQYEGRDTARPQGEPDTYGTDTYGTRR